MSISMEGNDPAFLRPYAYFPPQAPLIDMATAASPTYLLAVVNTYAARQDNCFSAQLSDKRDPYSPDKPRQPEAVDPAKLGHAFAEYAEVSVVLGLIRGRFDIIKKSRILFGTAQWHLNEAQEWVAAAYNARRAAEAAALTGNKKAFWDWCVLGEIEIPHRPALWQYYGTARENYTLHYQHEKKAGHRVTPERVLRSSWGQIATAAAKVLIHYANTVNEIPPELADAPHEVQVRFLEERHQNGMPDQDQAADTTPPTSS